MHLAQRQATYNSIDINDVKKGGTLINGETRATNSLYTPATNRLLLESRTVGVTKPFD